MAGGQAAEIAAQAARLRSQNEALGLGVFDMQGGVVTEVGPVAMFRALPPGPLDRAIKQRVESKAFGHEGDELWLEEAIPLDAAGRMAGALVVLEDASSIHAQGALVWQQSFLRIVAFVLLIICVTLLIVRWFLMRPMIRVADRLRQLRMGNTAGLEDESIEELSLFTPLAREVETMAESLVEARAAAETEARLRGAGEHPWTAERLAVHIREHFGFSRIFVLSNREPYIHVRKGRETVRELLTRIERQGLTRMVVVTGRSASEIVPLLGIDPPLEVWGLHGAERLYPDGRRELQQVPAAAREKLNKLRALLMHDSLGGLFEDKANGLVMHWRGASACKAGLIEQRIRGFFEPLAGTDGLELLEFEAGVELRVGRDKGGAVRAILQESAPGAPVAYLGDDLTDEAGFLAVNNVMPHGLSVLVRRQWRHTAANIWLRPPADMRRFLEDWLQACARRL